MSWSGSFGRVVRFRSRYVAIGGLRACEWCLNLRSASDPLLAAFVDLLLPERHPLLERVDRVLARGEGILAMLSRDGDDDGCLSDLDPAGAVVDRDLQHVVTALELCG